MKLIIYCGEEGGDFGLLGKRREYIPELKDEKRIISSSETEFEVFSNDQKSPKPHLPNFILPLGSIDDLKYIIIKDDSEKASILASLNNRNGEGIVSDAILNGRLIILTNEQIRNDF